MSSRAAPGAPNRVSPARELAFATLRATFEDDAFTERAFRAEADRLALDGRDRAQAQRLAYGAVQRRGTSDVAIARLAGRSIRLLDPPVLHPASTSCSSPTRLRTTPPSTRRSS